NEVEELEKLLNDGWTTLSLASDGKGYVIYILGKDMPDEKPKSSIIKA
ncbi:hypothetical protein LCGC14_1912880, partial [marine sediment metagenome]